MARGTVRGFRPSLDYGGHPSICSRPDNILRVTSEANYTDLYSARMDLGEARQFAEFLLKKAWHFAPWERRGTIYCQQSAFVTAFIVSYIRPFSTKGQRESLGFLMEGLTDAEKRFHETMLRLRNKVYGHSDSSVVRFQILPRDGERPLVIESIPFRRLEKFELQAALLVITKLQRRITEEMERLGPTVSAPPPRESVEPVWSELKADAAAVFAHRTEKGEH